MTNKNQVNKETLKKSLMRGFLYATLFTIIFQSCAKKEDIKPVVSSEISTTSEIKKERIPSSFKNEKIEAEINLVGGKLDSLLLNEYKETLEKEDKQKLFSPKYTNKEENKEYSYLNFGISGQNINLPTSNSTWKVIKETENSKTISWANKDGIKIEKTFSLADDYLIEVSQTISNNTGKDISVFPYAIISKKIDTENKNLRAFSGLIDFSSRSLEKERFENIKDEPFSRVIQEDKTWSSFSDNYFATAFLMGSNEAAKKQEVKAFLSRENEEEKSETYQLDYTYETLTVKAGESFTVTDKVFTGPKERSILKDYSEKYGAQNLDLLIDYGFFAFFSKIFFSVIEFLFNNTGSIGWAVILFAIFIKVLLHPISKKSMDSMAKMKKLGPEMKKIQTYHKNDKMRMQMEMAALYKKHQINPLSGCLPLLVQLPIFLALYKVLMNYITLRHHEFLWIHDLSSFDQTSIFNLFGLLPFTPWTWLPNLGILPILMGVTMFFQMKMQGQTATMTPEQAKVMNIMPFIMILLFASLPAGLILYYVVYNVLTIADQAVEIK
jgi:YidC/Oxa1 family membrane protein insertase